MRAASSIQGAHISFVRDAGRVAQFWGPFSGLQNLRAKCEPGQSGFTLCAPSFWPRKRPHFLDRWLPPACSLLAGRWCAGARRSLPWQLVLKRFGGVRPGRFRQPASRVLSGLMAVLCCFFGHGVPHCAGSGCVGSCRESCWLPFAAWETIGPKTAPSSPAGSNVDACKMILHGAAA